MKRISHANISLCITFLAVINIAIHGADNTIQFKTKEDLKEFYFKHIHLEPQELDQRFNKEFFEKNPLSILVTFPVDNSDSKTYGHPISNWHEFIKTWPSNCHISLLEGIFVYTNYTDPQVLTYIYEWLSKYNQPVEENDIERGYFPSSVKPFQKTYTFGDIIPGLIVEQTYNYAISAQERKEAFASGNKNLVYRYRVASEDVGKAVVTHSDTFTDNCLKNIALRRPDVITAFLRVYGSHHSLTTDQATRFKDLGFQVDEKTSN